MAGSKEGYTRVEVDGLDLSIEDAAIYDIETLDLLDEVSEGNALKIKKLMVGVLGKDGWAKVRARLADGAGRVSAEDAADLFGRVMEAYGAKN